jgi:CheY-like chemotaxis protein
MIQKKARIHNAECPEYLNFLIAEDDKEISKMYCLLLRKIGHRVKLADDGEKCLIIYNNKLKNTRDTTNPREHVQPFDAVVLDHRMPKMNGLEVAKEIISINPHQRIIIASAYSRSIFEEAADFFKLPLEILQKPFSTRTLINILEDTKLYEELRKYFKDLDPVKKAKLRHEQLKAISELEQTRKYHQWII